jgi:hypothetical protein
LRLYLSRAPDLNTTHRVLSRSLEIAHEVERSRESPAGPYDEHRVVLILRERIDTLGNLHRCRQLVSDEGIAPLTH